MWGSQKSSKMEPPGLQRRVFDYILSAWWPSAVPMGFCGGQGVIFVSFLIESSALLEAIFDLFWCVFLVVFLDAVQGPKKAGILPKTMPKWHPKWLRNRSFWQAAECELDTASAAFGRCRLPQESSQNRSKISKDAGVPSGVYFGLFWSDLGLKKHASGSSCFLFWEGLFWCGFQGGLGAPEADGNRFRGPPRRDLGRRNLLPKLFGYIIRIPLSF